MRREPAQAYDRSYPKQYNAIARTFLIPWCIEKHTKNLDVSIFLRTIVICEKLEVGHGQLSELVQGSLVKGFALHDKDQVSCVASIS